MLFAVCNYDYYETKEFPVLQITALDENNQDAIILVHDDYLAPDFFILKSDEEVALKVWRENGLESLIYIREDAQLKSALDEPLVRIATKFPRDIYPLKNAIDGLLTFLADDKWEKKCFQKMKWKEFLEIDDYNPWAFTPLQNIHNSKRKFFVKRTILYWDIETDSKGQRRFADWRNAPKMEIISYSIFNNKTKSFTWYGWKPDWQPCIETSTHKSAIPIKSKFRRKQKDYPLEFPLTIKKFNNEKDMHLTFIKDVSLSHPHGIMVFNGRGGNRIIRGKRKWFDGFDSQMFYERCKTLGIYEELQELSPIPILKNGSYITQPSVKSFDAFENNEQTKHEIYFKCIPMHDLLFDDLVLFYTKEEYKMKRHNLDTYMVYFLESEKVKHKGSSVAELFAKDWETEMYYNCVDVEALYALDLNFNYTNEVAGRALLYGGKIEDGVYASKLHDHINLWFTSNEYIMETRDNERTDNWQGMITDKMGGFNLEPKVGMYGYWEKFLCFMVDFSKLYPTCAMTANADLRTKINLKMLHISPNGLELEDSQSRRFLWDDCARSPSGFFRKDILSLNTQIYQELIKERKVYQKMANEYKEKYSQEQDPNLKDQYFDMYKLYNMTQFSYKGLINGKYGAEGMEGTRMYDKVTYNTPPAMGQEIIKFVIFEALPKLGYDNSKILFSSTDSVLITAFEKEDVHKCIEEAEKLTEELNKLITAFVIKEFNPIKSYIKLDCEKIADVCMLYDKRRYMLNLVAEEKEDGWLVHDEPRPFWKGLQMIRKDSSFITGEVQDKILEMIRKRQPFSEIEKYIIDLDNTFGQRPWETICSRASISNNSEDVDNDNQRYKAIDNANKYMDKNYMPGDGPLLGIFSKRPDRVNGNYLDWDGKKFVMAFDEEDEFPLKKIGFDLDYDHIKQKNVIDVIDPMLTFFGDITYKSIIAKKLGGFMEL